MSLTNQLPAGLKKSLEIQVKLFQKVGLNIYDNDENSGFVKKYGKSILFNTMFLIFSAFQWAYICAATDDAFVDKSSAFSSAMIFVQDIIIFILITLKKPKIQEVFLKMAEVWPHDDLEENQKKIFNDWLGKLYSFNRWYSILVGSGVTIALVTPLTIAIICSLIGIDTDIYYTKPVHNIYPFQINSTFRFAPVFIFEVVAIIAMHFCAYTPVVMLMFTLTYNVGTLLHISQIGLENSIKHHRRITKRCISIEEDAIKRVVETHQKLLRIVGYLNDIFSPTVFIPICVSMISMCLYSFIVTISEGLNIIIHLIGLLIIFFNLLSLIWPGQFLIDMSSGVSDAAYRSLWYERDAKLRKYILTIITRSQNPACLTALGFADVRLAVLFKILNTTWSFTTLVNKMYNKNSDNV